MLAKVWLFKVAVTGIAINLIGCPISAGIASGNNVPHAIAVKELNLLKLSPWANCEIPQGWSQVARRHTKFVVFGEIHGTREAPAFVENIACALATGGERILVAIEHDAIYNSAFQSAWNLPQESFEAAIGAEGWAGREDGVGSKAMMGLLVNLHSLKLQGKSIDVVAFNGAKDDAQSHKFRDQPGQGPHEAAQAENIRDAAEVKPYDHVLVLVGNLHARKRPVERGNSSFRPMVMQLAPPEAITTLNMKTSGGKHWSCGLRIGVKPGSLKAITANEIECGVSTLQRDFDSSREPFISTNTGPSIDREKNYDGFFWLGAVSASPPAVRKR